MNIRLTYTLEMDIEDFKSLVREAIEKRDGSKWFIKESLLVDRRDLEFEADGHFWVDERMLSAKCTADIYRIQIVDQDNNDYLFEMLTDDLGYTVYDAINEVANEYSVGYTKEIQIKNTDK